MSTKAKGPRKSCVFCNAVLYSVNTKQVCISNPRCKAINRFLSRHPDVKISDLPPILASCPSCNEYLTVKNWSIDKLIPALGYVKGNMSWLCMRCNRLKGNASLTELQNIVAYMERSLNERSTNSQH